MSFHLFKQLRLLLIFGVLACGLASCASFKKEKSGAELRKEGYEALLKAVKPGMYRRQLYAVLPPYKMPMARPPFPGAFAGLQLYYAHLEKHELDEECWLAVRYQIKNGKEYPEQEPVATGKRPATIDELLVATELLDPPLHRKVPSRENPDDIILSISSVCPKDRPFSDFYSEDTSNPTQEHGWKFGRKMEIQQMATLLSRAPGVHVPIQSPVRAVGAKPKLNSGAPLAASGADFPFVYPQPAPFAGKKPKSVSDRPPLP